MKRLQHPVAGPLALDYSAFFVDGGTGLSMIVYTPATPADAQAIASLLLDRT
jgi:MmyB-like transcription regulator ligand binding domain